MPLRTFTGPSGQTYTASTGSVFEVLTDDDAEVIRFEARAFVLDRIIEKIDARGWTQAEAARVLHTTQSRVSMLMSGRLSQFSLDALVEYAVRAGVQFGIVAPDAFAPVSPGESWIVALDSPAASAHYYTGVIPVEQAPTGAEAWERRIFASQPSIVAATVDDAPVEAVNDYSYQLAS